MQKLRPYFLPGLFVFHLVVLCVMLAIVSGPSAGGTVKTASMAAIVTVVSQFFLTALFAGLGSGSLALRIPSWGALAGLSWLSYIFFLVQLTGRPRGNTVWQLPLLFLIAWVVLVTLLLLLRVTPFLKWRVALQSTLAAPQSDQLHQDSLTRGLLIVVATWAGVLMLLKDSWPWSDFVTEFRQSSGDLLSASGIATIVGARALVVAMLAVGLTLTRLADWIFYRRRWTLPLLVIVTTGAAVGLLLSFGGPFRSGSERLLAALWLLLGLATQPLSTLLVMGMAGYRLAPRKSPEPHASEPASDTPQPTTTERAENWLFRLQRVQFAAPITVLVFLGWIGMTGLWNDHFIWVFLGHDTRMDAGEITQFKLKSSVTDGRLVHLKGLTSLQSLNLENTQITDAGLVHLKGLTNLQRLGLGNTKVTDAGLVHLVELKQLQRLSLYGTQVTDVGLVYLKGLTELQKLYLWETKVTDAGLLHLEGLTKLQELNLYRTKITNAGLVHLKGLTNLKELNLRGSEITDDWLVHLQGLTKLQTLGLSDTKVTNAGLVHLKTLSNLQKLYLSGTQVTGAGIAELKKTLPKCSIIGDGGGRGGGGRGGRGVGASQEAHQP